MDEQGDREVRLAEYAALRAEIIQRSGFQQAIIGLNTTTVAAVVGVAIDRHSSQLLLVIPVVSITLGFLWLDHHRNIQSIARYIRDHLWWSGIPSWEEHRRTLPQTGGFGYFMVINGFFGFASVFACGVAFAGVDSLLRVFAVIEALYALGFGISVAVVTEADKA